LHVKAVNCCENLAFLLDISAPAAKASACSKRQVLMTSVFTADRSMELLSNRDAKTLLIRRLAYMCCRDLSPFSIVDKPGFRTFLQQTGVVKDSSDIPDRSSLSRGGLDSVYDSTLDAVKQLIQTSPHVVAMTTDMWTDNYRRRSYATFTLHFCDANFHQQSVMLKTTMFPGRHTGENIKQEMTKTVAEFGLDSKQIIYVTDNGANIVKACKLAGVERLGCVAHGVHNLISVDGIENTALLKKVVSDVKTIVHAFVYKTSMLEEEGRRMVQEELIAQIQNEDVDVETVEYGDDEESDQLTQATTTSNQHGSSRYTTTLKKDCPTRWNSVMTMLESLIKSRQLVERCLASLQMFDKIPSLDDWATIEDLVKFLKAFKKATELLSGSDYPTCSITLLFRAELASTLEAESTDSPVIAELKRNMRAGFDRRFPISDLHVSAAMLDPSQRHLAIVQEYLTERDTSGVQFLSDMITKYCSGPITDAEHTASGTGPTDDGEPAWKKAKQEMLAKHGSTRSTRDKELQQYRCISVASDDLLHWWKTQRETFPKLSQLAQCILAVPATSAPSERVFSIAGLVIQAKRSSLAPENVNKIIFIHNNGHLPGGFDQ